MLMPTYGAIYYYLRSTLGRKSVYCLCIVDQFVAFYERFYIGNINFIWKNNYRCLRGNNADSFCQAIQHALLPGYAFTDVNIES